tara:strand:- start:448 stop:615 length:168 start_codon:yes stop_codon:yes gene_type:complete
MTVAMISFGGLGDDPLLLVGNIIAVAAIGVMIYFGYKHISRGGKDGGIKVKVPKM